jgi:signal transduction histidine kinase
LTPKVRETERVAVRRRHDNLLIAMALAASELLKMTSMDQSISHTLGIIGEVIGSNRAFVFEADPISDNKAGLLYFWESPDRFIKRNFEPIPTRIDCPPEFAGLFCGKAITATRNGASCAMQEFLDQLELSSILFAPIMIEGTYWGYLGFDVSHAEKPWTIDEISIFHTMAGLIGAAITRERYVKQLAKAHEEALTRCVGAETANASKTSFLTTMSHELRSPLNAILGFSSILMTQPCEPADLSRYKEYASDIHQSGSHLLSLINDLLDIAKIDAGRMEIEPRMLQTQDALDHALRVVDKMASERKQVLATTVDPEAAILYADERAFTQIAINLLSNAVKFAPDGGHIVVNVRRDANGDFELAVADNGPGIPKEKLERLFQPFGQADNRYAKPDGGTGLGLTLVRGLAELHGGRAWLESEEGRGTRAVVLLPAQDKLLPPQMAPRGRIAAA